MDRRTWDERLRAEEQRGLRRRLPDPRADSAVLDFASNDYLGLRRDPRVIAAAREALDHDGVGSGASRLLGGNATVHVELERDLARLKGTDAALVFSSGYAANLGLLTSISEPEDVIYCDRLDHASLVDGARLARAELRFYRHGDPEHLRRQLARRRPTGRAWVATDGVFSMDGVLAPVPDLAAVAREFDATLIVDDAHATGVLGPEGAGTVRHFELDAGEVVQMGTLSKALGCQGGFVAGPDGLIDWLVQRARSFVYSTGLALPVAAAARRAIELARGDPLRARRQRSFDRLRHGLRDQGWVVWGASPAPMLAVVVESATAATTLAAGLRKLGVAAPAIRPPTVPRDSCRLRLAPTASMGDAEIDRALEAFARVRRADRPISGGRSPCSG
ncbi:MAG TPA: 8-amino-7-oxononanoate synthase [Candidatus Krumholzibacteria bacterium]|nr:8-amino-7-oxononanoate synthase [Candidatus Krumholzibacteria bacterium]